MGVAEIIELAKISPYLVLPAIFIFILWKIYKSNNDFIVDILNRKSKQFESISDRLKELTDIFTAYITTFEKDMQAQHEKHNENIQNRIEALSEKVDAMRLEIAQKEK